MEHSYIKYMDKDYLNRINFNDSQISKIADIVNYAISEELYTHSKVMYHDLKHIEKVLIYAIWICNEITRKGIIIVNEDILLYAGLFHDAGRSIGASDKTHGIVGAQIAHEKLFDLFSEKDINSIELLIETHAVKDNKIHFRNFKYNSSEKNNIQLLSDILKDSDALDRNRLKLFPFWKCKYEYLRTEEAKKIFEDTDELYNEYNKAIKRYKKRIC